MPSKRELYNRLAQVGGLTAAKRNGQDGFKGVRAKAQAEWGYVPADQDLL